MHRYLIKSSPPDTRRLIGVPITGQNGAPLSFGRTFNRIARRRQWAFQSLLLKDKNCAALASDMSKLRQIRFRSNTFSPVALPPQLRRGPLKIVKLDIA
jgi:hypothetical protein